jgi:general secretion pathway protein C
MNPSEEITKTLKKIAEHVQPQTVQDAVNWASATLQKRGIGFYGKVLTVILSTYFMSDLVALVADRWIPEAPIVPRLGNQVAVSRKPTLEEYNSIFGRNLFNSQGKIPGEASEGTIEDGGPATPTILPLRLVGTMIFADERRNLATIEDKSKSEVFPVLSGDEIPSLLKILKIETYKVTFINKNTGRKEFIDIPEDKSDKFRRPNPAIPMKSSLVPTGPGIEKVSGNQYVVSRLELDKQLADFNSILTQARAFPNIENGVPAGYKIVQIVPGSVYDKLGIQNEDVITGVDGQTINDPMKAMALFEKLKETSHMELQIKRGGRPSTLTYEIR